MIMISTSRKRFGRPPSRESEEDIKSTALEARMRHSLGVEEWQAQKRGARAALNAAMKKMDKQELGYPLGILLAHKQINQKQHDAGPYFAYIWTNNARITGAPKPNLKAIDYGANTGGYSTHAEDTPEWVADIKDRFARAYAAIYNANGDHGRTSAPMYEILKRVLVEDQGPKNASELGALRTGLNAINKARGA